MKKQVLIAMLSVVVTAALTLLGGCDKQESATSTTSATLSSKTQEESYDCNSLDDSNSLKASWCDAKTAFEHSTLSADKENFNHYLRGYRNGVYDASQGKTRRVSAVTTEGKKESPEDSGYRTGYQSVVTRMGIIEFDCRADGDASEYRERWCEAADSYRLAGIGSDNNPFLRGRYIDGYMAGGRVALTVPTSMESFFSGENPEGKQPAITPPSDELKGTELAFYRGFDEGYKAMIASIRESINQVMDQMQVPNNMQLPDGMAPEAPPAG